MRRSTVLAAVAAVAAAGVLTLDLVPRAAAHCEVPCGIYDDPARVALMFEDATTIGKAVDEILALAGRTDAPSVNQAARWVHTKEEHATRIQHTIAQYFMTQRIKPAEAGSAAWEAYATSLAEHHAVLLAAMKTKQTVDPAAVEALRAAIEKVGRRYPPPKASR
jgi:nickel superoxide dismutase